MNIEHGVVASIVVNAVLENVKEHFQSFDVCIYFVKYSFRKHFVTKQMILCALLT